MPGPGQKKKAKPKRSGPANANGGTSSSSSGTGTFVPSDDFLTNVKDAEGWAQVAGALCTGLNLPDLDTRSGLRKVHKDFDKFSRKLTEIYDYSRHSSTRNDLLAGGVIAVYSKMSRDAILRDKIYTQAGFLSMAIPLLFNTNCIHVVLYAFDIATRHHGTDIKTRIANQTPEILQYLESNPDDLKAAELAVGVISRSVGWILNDLCHDHAHDTDIPRILRTFIRLLRHPKASPAMLDHALYLFARAIERWPSAFHENSSALNLLIASLRHSEVRSRAFGLAGALRLYAKNYEVDETSVDLAKMMSAMNGDWPSSIGDVIYDYPIHSLESVALFKTTAEFQSAMMKAVQDHDMLSLGLKLADLILLTEYSIPNGRMGSQDPVTGRELNDNAGLPFATYPDSLPLCARALRTRARTAPDGQRRSLEDKADILDLKYYLMKKQLPQAHPLARKAMERSPRVGYWYYVLTLGTDIHEGLRAAKQGLMCPNLTNYLRFALLYRASEHAIALAIKKLEEACESGKALDEGFAFAMCAYEDTSTFLREAPPDARRMKSAIYIHSMMMFLVKGKDLTQSELKESNEKLRIADEIARHLSWPMRMTQLRQARQIIVDRLEPAWQEWGHVIVRLSLAAQNGAEAHQVRPDKAEEDFIAWLEREVEDPDVRGNAPEDYSEKSSARSVDMKAVELYRCSWCRNPSAVLKRCKGCGGTTYCGASCQMEHWKTGHKKVCKKAVVTGGAADQAS